MLFTSHRTLDWRVGIPPVTAACTSCAIAPRTQAQGRGLRRAAPERHPFDDRDGVHQRHKVVVERRDGSPDFIWAIREQSLLAVERETGRLVVVGPAVARNVQCHGHRRLVSLRHVRQFEQTSLEPLDAAHPQPADHDVSRRDNAC